MTTTSVPMISSGPIFRLNTFTDPTHGICISIPPPSFFISTNPAVILIQVFSLTASYAKLSNIYAMMLVYLNTATSTLTVVNGFNTGVTQGVGILDSGGAVVQTQDWSSFVNNPTTYKVPSTSTLVLYFPSSSQPTADTYQYSYTQLS